MQSLHSLPSLSLNTLSPPSHHNLTLYPFAILTTTHPLTPSHVSTTPHTHTPYRTKKTMKTLVVALSQSGMRVQGPGQGTLDLSETQNPDLSMRICLTCWPWFLYLLWV